MFSPPLKALALAAVIATPLAAVAQDRMMQNAIAARQGVFQNYQLMLATLGGMARGNVEYDAEAAQAAANNLVALTQLEARFSWPPGSDNASVEGTRALPAIWENFDDVIAKAMALNAAATELAAVAGDGQAALGPAIGAVGPACTACHDHYRASGH